MKQSFTLQMGNLKIRLNKPKNPRHAAIYNDIIDKARQYKRSPNNETILRLTKIIGVPQNEIPKKLKNIAIDNFEKWKGNKVITIWSVLSREI